MSSLQLELDPELRRNIYLLNECLFRVSIFFKFFFFFFLYFHPLNSKSWLRPCKHALTSNRASVGNVQSCKYCGKLPPCLKTSLKYYNYMLHRSWYCIISFSFFQNFFSSFSLNLRFELKVKQVCWYLIFNTNTIYKYKLSCC